MIIDIVQTIVDRCALRDQIMCLKIDSHVYDNTYIYELDTYTKPCFFDFNGFHISELDAQAKSHCIKYSRYHVDQKTIEQKKFSRLKKLLCYNGDAIYNVSHLSNTLEELDCGGKCAIGDDVNGYISLSRLKKLHIQKKGMPSIAVFEKLGNTLTEIHCFGFCYTIENGIIASEIVAPKRNKIRLAKIGDTNESPILKTALPMDRNSHCNHGSFLDKLQKYLSTFLDIFMDYRNTFRKNKWNENIRQQKKLSS